MTQQAERGAVGAAAQRGRHSLAWTRSAFYLTVPSRDLVNRVICQDDCARCPLFTAGCAGACLRWDDAVCHVCPCLGSRHAPPGIRTVDASAEDAERPMIGGLGLIRARRYEMEDGQPI